MNEETASRTLDEIRALHSENDKLREALRIIGVKSHIVYREKNEHVPPHVAESNNRLVGEINDLAWKTLNSPTP